MVEETSPRCHVVLGHNPVQPDNNRVALPFQVFEMGLLDLEGTAFWLLLEPEARICVSGMSRTVGSFRQIDTSSIQRNRVVTIPKPLFPDYEGKAKYAQQMPEKLQFDYGETLHFITTEILYRNDAFYVLKDKDGRGMVAEHLGGQYMTDGGRELAMYEAELDRPTHVFLVEEERSVPVETAEEVLSELADEPFDIDTPPSRDQQSASGQDQDVNHQTERDH